MTKTLYVTDLDGTLLNNGSFVSDLSAHILSELASEGTLFTVATARTPATVVPLMAATAAPLPFIVFTGAATFDRRTMSYLHPRFIAPDKSATLLRLFSDYGVNPFIYRFDSEGMLVVAHDRQMTEVEEEFYHERTHLKLKRFTFNPVEPAADTILCFAMGPTEQVLPLSDAIAATGQYSHSCYPDIFHPEISIIEVFDIGVSKASAITAMANRIEADRIVVFGDNLNDLTMMEIADVAVAVANAQPAVRAAADVVIGPNYDDSVARFIANDFNARHI